MGLERARRDIEDAVRVFLGSALSATWSLAPGSLDGGENVAFWVPHERCIRSHEAARALEDAIARITSRATGEKWLVSVIHDVAHTRVTMQKHRPKKGRWVSLEERRRAEQAVARVVEGTERFTWHFDADSKKRMLEVNHRNLMEENPDLDRGRMAIELWREIEKAAPYMDVLRVNIGDEETRITFGPARHLECDPIASTNAFYAEGVKVEEPLLIIRDELGDWTRERCQKKTEEREMFAVNKIVAITEETKTIKLVVHKGETQKEMTMTAQATAQHQNDTVWKVDVAGDVLVLHVGYVKD